jgi:PASTA domain-containing protein
MRAFTKPWLPVAVLMLAATACAQSAASDQPSFTPPSVGSPSPSPTLVESVVPDIRHVPLQLAKIRIRSAGLKFKVTDTTTTMSYLPNTVLTQDPRQNRTVPRKSLVKVTVSKPPKCDPSYPTVCIAPFSTGVTCQSVGVANFTVKAPDPYHLDPDRDGVGCETRRSRRGG